MTGTIEMTIPCEVHGNIGVGVGSLHITTDPGTPDPVLLTLFAPAAAHRSPAPPTADGFHCFGWRFTARSALDAAAGVEDLVTHAGNRTVCDFEAAAIPSRYTDLAGMAVIDLDLFLDASLDSNDRPALAVGSCGTGIAFLDGEGSAALIAGLLRAYDSADTRPSSR
jgi:hypothetical protein